MECGICLRDFGRTRQPTCVSCSRAQIYASRLDQLATLVDKEKTRQTVARVLQPWAEIQALHDGPSSAMVDLNESARKLEFQKQTEQLRNCNAQIQALRQQQDMLRQQIAASKTENAERRAAFAHRRSTLQDARTKARERHAPEQAQADTEKKRLEHRLDKVRKHTVSGRQKLCMETALLFGLRRRKSRASDPAHADTVYIGMLPIPDLRELNTVHPDIINASLAHITRFLATTSHYLGVRLPAEVVPPHAGHAQPGIFSLHSSYRERGKIRHLAIPKPLPHLAKDDSPIYNNFVDGLVLLAYDVAWLCHTQGAIEIDSWEGLCALGPNLYNLFLKNRHLNGKEDDAKATLGAFSHANTAATTVRHQVQATLAQWRLPSLASMVDKTKSHLLTEMSGAEWELLDEKEWEEEREDERAVLVGGARWSLAAGAASRMAVSYMTAAQDHDEREDSSKGWMKLKVRSQETST